MITPHRIAQIEVARICGRTDHTAGNGTGRSAHGGIAGRSTDNGTTGSTDHCTAHGTVTLIVSATRKHKCRGKTRYH